MNKDFYVYAYYDKDNIPFYIGMGRKDRIVQHLYKRKAKDKDHLFFYNKLNKIIDSGECFLYKKLRANMTKKEAIDVEQVLIKLIGRRDLNEGPLCNLTDGGEGAFNTTVTGQRLAIYDTDTLNLVKTFRSIHKASKFLGVNESTVRIAESRHDKTGLPIKYYVLRFNSKPLLTFPFTKPELRYDRFTKKIKAINIDSKEVKIFPKVRYCAEYFNVCRKTIPYRIKHKIIADNWILEYDKQ